MTTRFTKGANTRNTAMQLPVASITTSSLVSKLLPKPSSAVRVMSMRPPWRSLPSSQKTTAGHQHRHPHTGYQRRRTALPGSQAADETNGHFPGQNQHGSHLVRRLHPRKQVTRRQYPFPPDTQQLTLPFATTGPLGVVPRPVTLAST